MSLVSDLFEHYKSLVEAGELEPHEVPTAKEIRAEQGCKGWVAALARKLLMESGIATSAPRPALPLGPIDDMVMAFEFFPNVLPRNADGCLLWDGAGHGGVYGGFKLNGCRVLAHRVAYEYRHGPTPEGMEIDHVFARGCRSKLCVNHEHLEAVTRAENTRRGLAARRWMAGISVCTELDDD